MSKNSVGAAPGSIKASRGYAQKVTDNPVLAGRRDIAFLAQSDDVPYLKDKTARSRTICTLRVTNLPESVSLQNRNTHLVAVQPSVYLSWNHAKKRPMKVHHNPKNQAPIVTVLCDELYTGYVSGWQVVDHSIPVGTPGWDFVCRAVLSLWFVHHFFSSHTL